MYKSVLGLRWNPVEMKKKKNKGVDGGHRCCKAAAAAI
jgi:hypothetical protein